MSTFVYNTNMRTIAHIHIMPTFACAFLARGPRGDRHAPAFARGFLDAGESVPGMVA
jgi:hypothetical protein